MKNFKKKAIFAALMGALSTVSSLAIGKSTLQKTEKETHIRSKSKPQKKRTGKICLLSPDDTDFDDKMNQIKKIWLTTFSDDWTTNRNRNPSLLATRKLMRRIIDSMSDNKSININEHRTLEYAEAQYGKQKGRYVARTLYLHPGYDLDDKYVTTKELKELKNDSTNIIAQIRNKIKSFLIYTNDGGQVLGYIEFRYTNEKEKNICIDWLACDINRNNQGIGGAMLRYMQSIYKKISLQPKTDSIGFYKRLGFKWANKYKTNMIWEKNG